MKVNLRFSRVTESTRRPGKHTIG